MGDGAISTTIAGRFGGRGRIPFIGGAFNQTKITHAVAAVGTEDLMVARSISAYPCATDELNSPPVEDSDQADPASPRRPLRKLVEHRVRTR